MKKEEEEKEEGEETFGGGGAPRGRREGVGGRYERCGSGGEKEEVKRAMLGGVGVKQKRERRSDGEGGGGVMEVTCGPRVNPSDGFDIVASSLWLEIKVS